MKRCERVFVMTLVFVCGFSSLLAQSADSLETPFRKGRWFTGLSGSISSSTVSLDTSSDNSFTNRYGFSFDTKYFVRKRLALGVTLSASRENAEEFVTQESELFLIGPSARYYVVDNIRGSLFFEGFLGYSKFFERTTIDDPNFSLDQREKGGGIGSFAALGFSYVVSDKIIFDLALRYNLNLLSTERINEVSATSTSENIRLADLSFGFGFNIILDEFFF